MNFWAIFFGTIACLVAGFIWYGPFFGNFRKKQLNMTGEKQFQFRPGLLTGPAFILLFLIGMIVAALLPAGSDWKDGLLLGAILGLGPFAGVGLNAIFTRRQFVLFLVDGGYLLAVFILFGFILGVWYV